MPVINTLEQFRYILTKIQDVLFEETGSNYTAAFKQYLKKGDTSEPDYRSASIIGFGQHMQKPELSPIRYDSLIPGRERVTTWKTYALGWRVSDRLMRDALKSKRVMKDKVKAFSGFTKRARLSAEWTQEAIAAYVLQNLESTVADPLFVGAGSDAVAFASASHPLIRSGGTASNINTALSLTSTAL